MALIKCNKCGKEVSDKADTCPYCDVIINPDAQVGDYKCNNCGAPVKEDDESCPECGAVFVEDEDEKNKQNCVVDNIEYTSSENFFKPFPLGAVIFIGVFLGIFLGIYYDTDIGIFFMMLFGIFICSIVILPNYLIKKNKRDDFLQYSKKKIDKIINSNQSYVSLTADVKGIAINDVSKIITIYNGVYEKPIKLRYKDILSFELIEDGKQEIQGKGAQTYLAGRYLGQNAALAVANSTRNINQLCNQLIIEIHLTDVNKKNISIEIIKNVSVNKESDDYKKLKEFSKNIITTLNKIMREIDEKNSKTSKSQFNNDMKQDIPEQLREYKKLLDDGILTKEEFELKKRELLEIKR